MDVRDEWLCITQLPDDLLSLIFQKLNLVCYQGSFSRTCHLFLDIAIRSCKCLKDDVTTKSYKLDSIVLGRCLHRFGHFELPLSISVLNLNHSTITDKGLGTLTKYCNKSLINVSLICCHQITNTGIWFLKQNCPQLRVLKISGCNKVVGWEQEWETLTYLEADAHVLYPPTGFLSGGGLEYLTVFNSNNLLFRRTRYNNLNNNLNHHIERGLANEAGLAAIGFAKNLKILFFWKGSFTDECIMKISKGCPLLQELNLAHCSGIGLPGWVSIGLHCQNLERLHVNNSKDFCDRGLLALGNGCKLLSVLYMTGCPQITSDGKHRFKIQRPDVKIQERVGRPCLPNWTW